MLVCHRSFASAALKSRTVAYSTASRDAQMPEMRRQMAWTGLWWCASSPILGLPDEGRDTLMGAALDAPDTGEPIEQIAILGP